MSRRGVESSRFRVGACGSRSARSVVAARANAAGAALDPGRVDADAPAALHVPAMPRFQGDGLAAANNVALINFLGRDSGSSGFLSQLLSGFEHLLLWFVSIDQTLRIDETEAISELDIRNSHLSSMNAQGGGKATVEAAGAIDHCSFGDDVLWGTNGKAASTIAYQNAAAGDFRLLVGAPGYRDGLSAVAMPLPTGARAPASPPDVGPFVDAASTGGWLTSVAEESRARRGPKQRPGRLL
jgi:hypothetical protein